MTRETKIGLLVGLAFIIVIGILLSDHLTSSTEPPQAALANAASSVRQAVGSPGESGASAPVTVVTPVMTPQQPVATQAEVTEPAPAVTFVKISGSDAAQQQAKPVVPPNGDNGDATTAKTDPNAVPDAGNSTAANVNPVTTPAPNLTVPTDSDLAKVAQAHGEQLVPVDEGKPAASAARSYVAQPGDSLSKIAAKFFGSGGKANRDLIIKANPSLAANEDMIIAGKTYQIPGKAAAKPSVADSTPPTAAPASDAASGTVDDSTAKTASATQDKPANAAADAGYLYTVKPGDNLTKIARDEVGDAHAIAAIQELNPDKIKGPNHDILIAGSKIRLPGKPLARAE